MESEFNFVPFEDAGGKYGSYYISVGGYGGFGLNAGFYKKENIRDFTHVLLSYDKNNDAVGFLFTNDPTVKGTCKITHTKNKNSGSVVVRSFFGAHSIDPKSCSGRYTPQKYRDEKMGDIYFIEIGKK